MANQEKIQRKAKKIYEMVIENRKQVLTDNSCDFKILEEAYYEYVTKNISIADDKSDISP